MNQVTNSENPAKSLARFSFYTSIVTFVLTLFTISIAINTPPLSGPFCIGSCFEYPYHDIVSRFPRDYYWMYPAILLSIVYLMLMACIHYYPHNNRKLFSQMGLLLAAMASMTLFTTYFVQVSVIQPSLLNNETDGISLLTQFNPHGLFIAMEEAGYLLMNLSFLFLVPVFTGKGKLKKALRITFSVGFMLAVVSFILISVKHGIMREYIFEVAIITIVWLELIISSVLMAFLFKRQLKQKINY